MSIDESKVLAQYGSNVTTVKIHKDLRDKIKVAAKRKQVSASDFIALLYSRYESEIDNLLPN